MGPLPFNPEPSKDLNYASVLIDERARAQRFSTIPSGPRFFQAPKNGDLKTVHPEVVDQDVRKTLPRSYQVDTTTRTVFSDGFYERGHPVHDFVSDPSRHCSGPRAHGHVPLNEVDVRDTRIRKVVLPYDRPLGPGEYPVDPLGEQSTGTLHVRVNDVHHVPCLARDPTRESVAFKSPERHHTFKEVAAAQARTPLGGTTTQPDYASWTSKGCWHSSRARVIEPDRWGPSPIVTRPAAKDRPQGEYDPVVRCNGSPNAAIVFTNKPSSMSYKTAFHSGLPAQVALQDGVIGDTRVVLRDYCLATTTSPNIGPGSYNPERPRLRSFNSSYDTAEPYFSNASGVPTSFLGEALSQTASAPTSPTSQPRTLPHLQDGSPLRRVTHSPASTHATFSVQPMSHNFHAPLGAGGLARGVASPSAHQADVARMEQEAEKRLASSLRQAQQAEQEVEQRTGSPADPLVSRADKTASAVYRAITPPMSPAPSHNVRYGTPDSMRASTSAPAASLYHLPGGAPPGGPLAAAVERMRNAPPGRTAATMMSHARHQQFGKLMFMTRHVPHQSLLKSRMVAVSDVRKARAAFHNAQGASEW